MRFPLLRPATVGLAVLLLLPASALVAQVPTTGGVKPTPAQAEELLRTRPDLVRQLRDRTYVELRLDDR